MERLLIVVAVTAVAVVIAALVQRRTDRTGQPVSTGYHVPAQLHRDDFDRPEAPWLVVVFSSATCDACATMVDKARALESDAVAVQEVEVGSNKSLHERYEIDGVPTTVITDAEGEVRSHFLGPATATHLWAAVAELRSPGSIPASCETHMADPHEH